MEVALVDQLKGIDTRFTRHPMYQEYKQTLNRESLRAWEEYLKTTSPRERFLILLLGSSPSTYAGTPITLERDIERAFLGTSRIEEYGALFESIKTENPLVSKSVTEAEKNSGERIIPAELDRLFNTIIGWGVLPPPHVDDKLARDIEQMHAIVGYIGGIGRNDRVPLNNLTLNRREVNILRTPIGAIALSGVATATAFTWGDVLDEYDLSDKVRRREFVTKFLEWSLYPAIVLSGLGALQRVILHDEARINANYVQRKIELVYRS